MLNFTSQKTVHVWQSWSQTHVKRIELMKTNITDLALLYLYFPCSSLSWSFKFLHLLIASCSACCYLEDTAGYCKHCLIEAEYNHIRSSRRSSCSHPSANNVGLNSSSFLIPATLWLIPGHKDYFWHNLSECHGMFPHLCPVPSDWQPLNAPSSVASDEITLSFPHLLIKALHTMPKHCLCPRIKGMA